jgi:hypothetical protein
MALKLGSKQDRFGHSTVFDRLAATGMLSESWHTDADAIETAGTNGDAIIARIADNQTIRLLHLGDVFFHAAKAPGVLVSIQKDGELAVHLIAAFLKLQSQMAENRNRHFRVSRTTTVEPAVLDDSGERWLGPSGQIASGCGVYAGVEAVGRARQVRLESRSQRPPDPVEHGSRFGRRLWRAAGVAAAVERTRCRSRQQQTMIDAAFGEPS